MRIGRVLWVQVRLGACKHIYIYAYIYICMEPYIGLSGFNWVRAQGNWLGGYLMGIGR